MNVESLLAMLTMLASVEMPTLHDGSETHVRYLSGLKTMAELYYQVGRQGRLVSQDADPLILAAIGWGESRHQPKVQDGDCTTTLDGKTRCNVVGPMQVAPGTMRTLGLVDSVWKGISAAELRDPRRNVEAAYRLLEHHRDKCGQAPGAFISGWASGRCWKRTISTAANRCHLAAAMAKYLSVAPPVCDGKVRSSYARKLIDALLQPVETQPKASDGH